MLDIEVLRWWVLDVGVLYVKMFDIEVCSIKVLGCCSVCKGVGVLR